MSLVVDRRHAATPRRLADWAIKRYGLELDVCASAWNAKLPRYYDLERGENGLVLPWDAGVWCNPPWASVPPWLLKAQEEICLKRCPVAVCCVPWRPGVKWWHKFVDRAHPSLSVIIHDFEGRIAYGTHPDEVAGPGGFEPTVLVVYEPRLKARDFN